MESSTDKVMQLVWKMKYKEDKTLEACIRSLNNVATLSRGVEEQSLELVEMLMNLEPTTARDEAIKYFKTQLGGNSIVKLKVQELVDEVEEKKKKRAEDVETLSIA